MRTYGIRPDVGWIPGACEPRHTGIVLGLDRLLRPPSHLTAKPKGLASPIESLMPVMRGDPEKLVTEKPNFDT